MSRLEKQNYRKRSMSLKKFAPELKSARKFKQIPKHLIYDDPNDNKSYLLGLKTYDGDNKELQDVKSQKYFEKFYLFAIYEAKKEEASIIGKYYKISKLNDIPKLIEYAYKSVKFHLTGRATAIILQINYISIDQYL